MSIILKKTDETCSSVQLIDENACLGNSFEIINSNVNTLVSGINAMVDSLSSWNDINFLSNFYSISGEMVNTMLNIKTIEKYYISPYTVIQNLSSKWNYKEFSLYYPTIIDFNVYYINQTIYDDLIKNWLTQNFTPNSFGEGQIVNVFLTLNYTNTFSYSFSGSYQENCTPTANSDNTLSCNGCGGDNRNAGCNQDAGKNHWCGNAYAYCHASTRNDDETYTCVGHVNGTYQWVTHNQLSRNNYPQFVGNNGELYIDYNWDNIEDTFIGRIVKFVYQNQNKTWVLRTL
jgi:hypothetical protein